MSVKKILLYLKKITTQKRSKNPPVRIEESEVKKDEMIFRDRRWFDFEGNLYRNMAELPSVLRDFTLNSSDAVLDVGAGSGRFTREFMKAGAEVVALDYSINSLKINKSRCNCHVVLADLCYLPFRPSVFDRTAALSVFQHIPSVESRFMGLREIRRVSKKGAQLLIEVYNYRLFDNLRKCGKEGYHKTSPPVYYYRFDNDEFLSLLLSVFSKIRCYRAILILQPLMRGRLGKIAGIVKASLLFESCIEKTLLSFLLADRILAICEN